MGQRRAFRLVPKVHTEVIVHLHPAVLSVNVDHKHHGALNMCKICDTLPQMLK